MHFSKSTALFKYRVSISMLKIRNNDIVHSKFLEVKYHSKTVKIQLLLRESENCHSFSRSEGCIFSLSQSEISLREI